MISRRQIAEYLVGLAASERPVALRQAAAWLIASRREHEFGYLVRDVATQLERHGVVWARATTAHQLPAATKSAIENHLKQITGADHAQLEVEVDASLLGGLKLITATSELDASLRTQLDRLTGGRP